MRLSLTGRHSGNFFPRDAFLSFTEKCSFVVAELFKIWKRSRGIFWVGKTWFEIIKAPQSHAIKTQSLGKSESKFTLSLEV